MTSRVFADINPEVLAWARESRGFGLEPAAAKIGVSPDFLEACEAGSERLSLPQLRKAARAYQRALAVFYLRTPPETAEQPPDFRRLPEQMGNPLSPALKLEIRRIRQKRIAAREMAAVRRQWDLSFLGSRRLSDDPEDVGAEVRQMLRIPDQPGWRNDHEAFRAWREAIEDKGVLVFLISGIEVSEMRGFSLNSAPPPVIAANRADFPRPRCFTLLHEFAHLLLGRTGLCDLLEEDYRNSDEHLRIEKFCNHAAGAALVPFELLNEHPLVRRHGRRAEWEPGELSRLSGHFRASREVVLRRLLISGRTTAAFYRRWRLERAQEEIPLQEGAAYEKGFEKVLRTQGGAYVSLVLDALHDDAITAVEASDYLDMKLKHLEALEEAVREAG